MDEGEKHFVLVHGTCHGAWCWYKLTTLLESAGHKVTALDLAGSGRHPKQVHELGSFSDYMEPLFEFMESLPQKERVILVGHSFGGLSVSAAIDRFPEKVSVAVFCTAFMPSPSLTSSSVLEEFNRRVDKDFYMDSVYTYEDGPASEPTSLLLGRNFMASMLYQFSPAEDLTLAALLTRPHRLFKDLKMRNEEAVGKNKENSGCVQRVYIVCDEDNIIKEDLQRLMIAKSTIDDVKVKLITGSDHMPMFSKPNELCNCLREIAQKFT